MRVLVHTCCGPCGIPVISSLRDAGHEPVGFFFNPNIQPLSEYMRRREGAIAAFSRLEVPLVLADTLSPDEQSWAEAAENTAAQAATENTPAQPADPLPPAVRPDLWLAEALRHAKGPGRGNAGGRCVFCWRARLRKTAALATGNGFRAFSSTLLFSRYQDHQTIRALGEEAGREYGTDFHYRDWRDLWPQSVAFCREWSIYRQQYCGCLFSEYDRYRRDFRKAATGAVFQ